MPQDKDAIKELIQMLAKHYQEHVKPADPLSKEWYARQHPRWAGLWEFSSGTVVGGMSVTKWEGLDRPTEIEILTVANTQEGNGHMGRVIDEFETVQKLSKVTWLLVTSDRLAGMLERRGYVKGEGDNYSKVITQK